MMKISDRKKAKTLCLMIVGVAAMVGCGSSDMDRPPQAAKIPPMKQPTAPTSWTKESKIAAIKKSSMSPDQKKAEIAKVESGQD